MEPKYIRILAGVGVVVVALVVVVLSAQKTVTISFEGQPFSLTTSALTVGGALKDAEIETSRKDLVRPSKGSLLKDGEEILVRKASLVTIQAHGEEIEFESAERIPANWMIEADIPLNPGDQILIDGKAFPPDKEVLYAPSYSVEVRPGKEVRLWRGDQETVFVSGALTLGQALWDEGIRLRAGDVLTPPPETPLDVPLTATLVEGKLVEITTDGGQINTIVGAETVGAALAEVGISLQGLDYSSPPEDQPLPEDGRIGVVRVREELLLEEETIPYNLEVKLLEDVELDTYKVVDFGATGIRAKQVRVRYEDGEEVSRTVGEEWLVREPRTRVEGWGSKIVLRTLDTPNGPIEYWRVVDLWVTSYSPCRSAGEPGKCYYYTSGGREVKRGVAAVSYDWWLKMNETTTVYVPGYGQAVISDVGRAPSHSGGFWIDLAYSDDETASWAKWVTVYFTTPLPPPEDIIWVLP
ncbi:MAG: ubiquitin-like domain-containing protein [Anaerolineales bacterium]|jgi:uncharacterized protein YabE (DUF348 family)